MARKEASATAPAPPNRAWWLAAFAALGLVFASSSAWVHYRLLHDPTYTSFCDVNRTLSCAEAYSSRYGSVAGVPVAVIGAVFFAFVLGLVGLCSRSVAAAASLPGYVFALSTLALAAVLYLGYASFVILNAVCLLCVGTYVAVAGLFIVSGSATRYPMTSLPGRLTRDLGALVRTPAALSAALAFLAAAVAAITMFPGEPLSAAPAAADSGAAQAAPAAPAASASQVQEFEKYLAAQPRVPVMVPSDGAAVVLVKFNDYQCPPCRQTYMEYKPVLAKWAKDAPGKLKFVTKDYPLERECNANVNADLHASGCEAAVAVRLAREKGKAEAMEEWIFANQPTLTPERVRQAAKEVGGVADMDARYAATLELVKSDIAQGASLKVTGTPTFFLNGIKLPGLRPEFLDAAIAWELKRVAGGSR
jgi:uncharacterized membrane protein/protein-disulfide isomerase